MGQPGIRDGPDHQLRSARVNPQYWTSDGNLTLLPPPKIVAWLYYENWWRQAHIGARDARSSR